jgi:hypothetical protein
MKRRRRKLARKLARDAAVKKRMWEEGEKDRVGQRERWLRWSVGERCQVKKEQQQK